MSNLFQKKSNPAIRESLDYIITLCQEILAGVNTINKKGDAIMAAQDDVNQATQNIEAVVTAEGADLASINQALTDIEAFIQNNPGVDTSGLLSAVSALQAQQSALDTTSATATADDPTPPTPPAAS